MKTMFVLLVGDYSDCRVCGVFSSQEKAQAAKAKVEEADPHELVVIESYYLDNNPMEPGSYSQFYVRMEKDGTTLEVRNTRRFPNQVEIEDSRGRLPEGATFRCFDVCARDATHAIKIVNERRVQLIAANKW